MLKTEFYSEYKRLHQVFPHKFMIDDVNKLKSTFEVIESLPITWLTSLINRMVRMNNPDLDIVKAAEGEIKAMRSAERTKEIINNIPEFGNDGLSNALKDLGVNSLLEAVLKK